jgi:hypothetical protein
MFFLQQNQKTRGWNRFCPEAVVERGGVTQIMSTHVSKCKSNKIKFLKKDNRQKMLLGGCEEKKTLYTVGRNVNWYSHLF